MDSSFVVLSDEQWARINARIQQIAQNSYVAGGQQISGVTLIFRTSPIGRMVKLEVDGTSTMIEDVL